jgi:hypothetical protein
LWRDKSGTTDANHFPRTALLSVWVANARFFGQLQFLDGVLRGIGPSCVIPQQLTEQENKT